ncbi:MAG TPA: ferritin-like domain-containing protein [Parvularculaceae bacterium]|nr:ferritin-like domain-containing protein [Caulobacterales bacterium]HOP21166.1 ferritin-like domain-containing protein [Amphiplicatus sp.]HPE30577.1 ferritin-like domain-containing protein [Parvularculaceae bacterium]HRX39169.1 ferritin-like domain-containing protein [Parvularculaceae bacterium]
MASLKELYPIPDIDDCWTVPQDFETSFDWRYDDGRKQMMHLYQKGKDMQWDAVSRIDWSIGLDEENPMGIVDELSGIYYTPIWQKMSNKEKAHARRHFQAWTISQFLQGEQAALICAAKIVQQAPDMDAKFYAATQVMDEARHVEAFKKLLEGFRVAYPMTPPLQTLVDQALRDSRWDMTYLAMQVVIEGLALAAFNNIRETAKNPLAQMVNAYVMQDESRHVAFGRLALRDFYPHLTEAERNEREEFLVEACYLMRDRFEARETYETLGLPVEECVKAQFDSGYMTMFRNALFQRIVPIVRDIGLWSNKIQAAYDKMGVLGFADTDYESLMRHDNDRAEEFDELNKQRRQAYVEEVAAVGANAAE